jgi:predicted acylesterase/phospholipase RssA
MTNGDDGTILVLQGGGAYGAYESGVYGYLATHRLLEDLVVVAGTSAGAINAAIIATHFGKTESHGAHDLDRFWHEVATPPLPSLASLPFSGEDARRWAAVWTSLLWGNPHMFTPRLWAWPLIPPALWAGRSFYDSAAMKHVVDRYAATVDTSKGGGPRLLVTAVDIESGQQRVFDSSDRELKGLTTASVVASGSLPPWLPWTTIGGRHYWDGGLWSNTPLPDVIDVLKKDAAAARPINGHWTPRRYRAIVVDVWRSGGPVPQSYWEAQQRINE